MRLCYINRWKWQDYEVDLHSHTIVIATDERVFDEATFF